MTSTRGEFSGRRQHLLSRTTYRQVEKISEAPIFMLKEIGNRRPGSRKQNQTKKTEKREVGPEAQGEGNPRSARSNGRAGRRFLHHNRPLSTVTCYVPPPPRRRSCVASCRTKKILRKNSLSHLGISCAALFRAAPAFVVVRRRGPFPGPAVQAAGSRTEAVIFEWHAFPAWGGGRGGGATACRKPWTRGLPRDSRTYVNILFYYL